MNLALWIIAGLPAAIFLVGGGELAAFVTWGRFGPESFTG